MRALYPIAVVLFLTCPVAALAQQPNVLFIAVDDLNDFPIGGHPETISPNLDRLAAAGMTFMNAQTPSPACNASRVAVVTGIGPETSGILLNSQNQFRIESPVLADAVTVFQHFKNHGYRIVGGGKLLHGTKDLPDTEWDDYPGFSGAADPDPSTYPLNGIAGVDVNGDGHSLGSSFDWGPIEGPGEPDITASTWEFDKASWAADQIEATNSTPTLVAVGFNQPHRPNYAPRKYFDLFPGPVQLPPYLPNDLDDVAWPFGNDLVHADVVAAGAWSDAVRGYLASIAFIDAAIGVVLDAWESSSEEWIVVLWSDHGLLLGEKDRWGKIRLWEESTRSILMIAGPGIDPGTVTHLPVSLIDIYPTLIDMAGLTEKPELEGTSLVPHMTFPESPFLDVPVTTINSGGHLAFRSRRWKYIHHATLPFDELYDHDSDPNEWTNLTSDPRYDTIKAWLTNGGLLQACEDGLDNDGDGLSDYPLDPGCRGPTSLREDPPCQDGQDNDGDGLVDFDGGLSIWGVALAGSDPGCGGKPWSNREATSPPPSCGLGPELALLLPFLAWARRRASTSLYCATGPLL